MPRIREVNRALYHETPADNRDDRRNPVPHIVERDDKRAQGEVHKAIEQTADLPLLAEHDEKLNPGARLNNCATDQ